MAEPPTSEAVNQRYDLGFPAAANSAWRRYRGNDTGASMKKQTRGQITKKFLTVSNLLELMAGAQFIFDVLIHWSPDPVGVFYPVPARRLECPVLAALNRQQLFRPRVDETA